MKKNQKLAYFYAGVAIFFWSTVASAFKIALKVVNVPQLLFYASITSFSVLLIYMFLFKEFQFPDKNQIFYSAFLGFINPFCYYLVLFKAYSLLPAQIAQPLNYTWPIVLSVFAVLFLKQHFSLRLLISILVSFSGVVILSLTKGFSGEQISLWGTILALLSALIWASYWIFNMKRDFSPVMGLSLNFLFGAVYSALFLFFFKIPFELPNFTALFSLIYVGLFEMGITFIFWFKALKLSDNTSKISNYIYISPFVSLVFIHYIVGETIEITTLYGLALIISGILIQSIKLNPKE